QIMEGGSDLKLLLKCPEEDVSKFIHGLIDGVCGKMALSYADYSSIWGMDDWWRVKDGYSNLIKHAMKYDLRTKDELSKACEEVPSSIMQQITDSLWVRREDIRRSLVEATCAVSQTYLTDFDWQLKLAMSSDKIASVKQPLVSVDLTLQEKGKTKNIAVELNKEDLQNMIASLEKANKTILQLKT
ncbi:unnamed protein product, partial [Owenia fusiformis]